jgi:tetratricopeptide (TPR) repeat protein
MAKVNLRAAFAGGIAPTLSAERIFTNRVSELASFAASIANLDSSLSAAEISPVVDRSAPRDNVLVYFGVGGIGKTTLSQELERRYLREVPDRRHPRTTLRTDFSDSNTYDFEAYILSMRAALGTLSRHWPAFDVALAAYWGRAHSGERLDEFINRDSALRRAARSVGMSEQISESIAGVVGDVILGGISGIAQGFSTAIYRQFRESISRHRVLRRCELLPELLDADPTIETLSYFSYLLAWDLERLRGERLRAVFFLDTFENLGDGDSREVERLIQRTAFLMPNVLFVITGRRRLDWADLTTPDRLDYVGGARWPNLDAAYSGADPRQHLVGYLSDEDAESYLAQAVSHEGQPLISTEIRDRVVTASAGFPLYLDLAVTTYLDIVSRGQTPSPEEFGQPLPAVTAKMLRDLDGDERDLLRAAALLERFDISVLRAGCPNVHDAAIRRFRNRPFLELDAERVWRYSIHDILRRAVLDADQGLSDSWSPRERASAAARMARHLERVEAEATDSGDRTLALAVFQQCLELCAATDQFFDWLVPAGQRLLRAGIWMLTISRAQSSDNELTAFLQGLSGARERRSGNVRTAISELDRALAGDGLSAGLRAFLLLHRAHALRVAGDYAAAARDYGLLAEQNTIFRYEAIYGAADYDFLDGRFDDAQAALDRLREPPADLQGEILRLRGHIFRVNGLFSRAERCYRDALDLAREVNNMAAEGKALTDMVQTLAWHRPSDVSRFYEKAVEVNSAIRNRIELVKLYAAKAVASAALNDYREAEEQIIRGLELTREIAYPGGEVWCWTARSFAKLRQDDLEGCGEAASHVSRVVEIVGGNRFWAEITAWWSATEDRIQPTTRWLEGRAETRERWIMVGVRTVAE